MNNFMMIMGLVLGTGLCGCGSAVAVIGPRLMIDQYDHDGDGYGLPDDCDDENSSFNPAAVDVPGDGQDQNCDGLEATTAADIDTQTDAGQDTAPVTETGETGADSLDTGDSGEANIVIVGDPNVDDDGDGLSDYAGDCDDAEPLVRAGFAEVCDGLDNDCDLQVDDGVMSDWHPDFDLDTFGDPEVTVQGCSAPANFVADDQDCNDADPLIKPTATEVCDEADVDEDCDGQADDLDNNVALKTLWLQDADNDGFGNEFVDTRVCDNPPAKFIPADSNGDGDEYNDARDCDDSRSDIFPGAPLGICDPTDTGIGPDFNCDGASDCP